MEITDQDQEQTETEQETVEEGTLLPDSEEPEINAEDRPEWLAEKFKSPEEMAKAYSALEKKLGGYTEAPDDYSFEADTDYPLDGSMLDWFKGVAKAANMDQESFETHMEGWIEAERGAMSASREVELKALGNNAEDRLKTLSDWGRNHLSLDQWEDYKGIASTAAGVELLESLVASSREAPMVNSENIASTQTTTPDELREMRAKKNEYGQLLASVDPEYRKQVDQAYADFYGD